MEERPFWWQPGGCSSKTQHNWLNLQLSVGLHRCPPSLSYMHHLRTAEKKGKEVLFQVNVTAVWARGTATQRWPERQLLCQCFLNREGVPEWKGMGAPTRHVWKALWLLHNKLCLFSVQYLQNYEVCAGGNYPPVWWTSLDSLEGDQDSEAWACSILQLSEIRGPLVNADSQPRVLLP